MLTQLVSYAKLTSTFYTDVTPSLLLNTSPRVQIQYSHFNSRSHFMQSPDSNGGSDGPEEGGWWLHGQLVLLNSILFYACYKALQPRHLIEAKFSLGCGSRGLESMLVE